MTIDFFEEWLCLMLEALDVPRAGSQIGLLGGLDERIRLAGAAAAEVVVVDGPEHDASQPVVAYILRLRA